MTFQKSILIDLMNNDSFVAWLRGGESLPESEKNRWNEWGQENPAHGDLILQAKKILEMPFNIKDISCISSGELEKLMAAIESEENINNRL